MLTEEHTAVNIERHKKIDHITTSVKGRRKESERLSNPTRRENGRISLPER